MTTTPTKATTMTTHTLAINITPDDSPAPLNTTAVKEWWDASIERWNVDDTAVTLFLNPDAALDENGVPYELISTGHWNQAITAAARAGWSGWDLVRYLQSFMNNTDVPPDDNPDTVRRWLLAEHHATKELTDWQASVNATYQNAVRGEWARCAIIAFKKTDAFGDFAEDEFRAMFGQPTFTTSVDDGLAFITITSSIVPLAFTASLEFKRTNGGQETVTATVTAVTSIHGRNSHVFSAPDITRANLLAAFASACDPALHS